MGVSTDLNAQRSRRCRASLPEGVVRMRPGDAVQPQYFAKFGTWHHMMRPRATL